MEGLFAHMGAEVVTLDDLRAVPMPEATETYTPLSHYDMAINIQKLAGDFVKKPLKELAFALGRKGNQLFGCLKYGDGDGDSGMAIGFRNSYDHSMAAGLVIGAHVFVCDNMALVGDICIFHKHTKNIMDAFQKDIINALYGANHKFEQIQNWFGQLKAAPVALNDGYRLIGEALGKELVPVGMATRTLDEWQHPTHKEFEPRTAWSLYNAFTDGAKVLPPAKVIDTHHKLATFFKEQFN